MKDILPGAQLTEVRIGINCGDTPLSPSTYTCTLVFVQNNNGTMEIVNDIYGISEEHILKSFPPFINIGKRIKTCTKTLLGDGFIVRYDFEDGTQMSTWS